ncbi:MAG: gliding motility-associated C-terminal domain-containing protein [Bacteroidales bacterium]|nr:gliding motility-associated C-terminal domain-containing protein [Bacteroidales bacterium]
MTVISFSQERAMVWYFGDHSGIDFKSGEPQVLVDGVLKAEAGCACICDENGNILFYTNGKKVWNRNHQIMTNGDSLNGSQLVNQNSVIVPKPLSDSIYYLFTLNDYDTLRGFNYSVINMNLEEGLGKLVEKNIPISINILEKIAAVEHCNGQDHWIITHGYDNDFYSYLVTDEEAISDTVKSNVGTEPKADIGYLKVSPAANKIVMPVNNVDILAEVFNFNNRTGEISNPVKVIAKHENTYCYGVEFSPNGNLLYISTGGKSYDIWQYDLRLQNEELFNSSSIHIASGNNFAMQLAPNDRIYIACENRPYLNAINKPNQLGEECEYQTEAVKFTQSSSLMGLPNFMQSWFYKPSFDFKNTCFQDSTLFIFYQYENTDSLIWDFGDVSKNRSLTDDIFSVFHKYEETGLYNVELEIYHCGIIDTITKQLEIFPYPVSTLISDTVICNNCSLVLDAGSGFDSYHWNNGGENRFSTVYNSGTYFVEVEKNGCCITDTVVVRNIKTIIELPNAFTPNGDGLNDVFRAINTNNVVDFSMWIHNRRGMIVYQSNDVFEGWDGKHLGRPCNQETFVWNITFSYYNEMGMLIKEVKKGLVTLIR